MVSYNGGDAGWLRMWGTGQAEPATSSININPTLVRSNLVTVVPGGDNSIWVRYYPGSASSAAVDLILDSEGWYATPNNLPLAVGSNCAASGQRASDQQTSHPLTDQASLAWNPVNGNLSLSDQLLTIRNVGQNGTVALRYNAVNDARPTLNVGWAENKLIVNPANGTVTVTAPDGGCYTYTPNGSGGYTKPYGFNASLTHPDADTYDLRMNPSGATNRYTDLNGTIWRLDSIRDATGGNYLRYSYIDGLLRQITLDDAPGRTVNLAYTDANNPTQPSTITDTALNRTITLAYGGPSGAMSSVTDPAGHALSFGYTNGLISSITDNAGTGHTTIISYDSSRRAASWTYPAVAGAAASSTFTPTYVSTTQTTLKDPLGRTATYTLGSTSGSAPSPRSPTRTVMAPPRPGRPTVTSPPAPASWATKPPSRIRSTIWPTRSPPPPAAAAPPAPPPPAASRTTRARPAPPPGTTRWPPTGRAAAATRRATRTLTATTRSRRTSPWSPTPAVPAAVKPSPIKATAPAPTAAPGPGRSAPPRAPTAG